MTAAALHAPWDIAKTFLTTLITFFGLPDELAGLGMIDRRFHECLRDWIRAGEALMRRLLLIEAAHCSVTQSETKSARPPRARKHAEPLAYFRALADGPAIPRPRALPKPRFREPPRQMFPIAGLARRLDALLAVARNPAGCALRLARKLRRAPVRVFFFLRYPENAPRLVGEPDFDATSAPLSAAIRTLSTPPPE